MLGEISIIAGIEKNSVKLCTMGSKMLCLPLVDGKTTNHNQLKTFRSAERVYNLKTYIRCGTSVKEHWSPSLLSATDEIQQDRNRGIASVNDKAL